MNEKSVKIAFLKSISGIFLLCVNKFCRRIANQCTGISIVSLSILHINSAIKSQRIEMKLLYSLCTQQENAREKKRNCLPFRWNFTFKMQFASCLSRMFYRNGCFARCAVKKYHSNFDADKWNSLPQNMHMCMCNCALCTSTDLLNSILKTLNAETMYTENRFFISRGITNKR